MRIIILYLIGFCLAGSVAIWAGPPFVTDDPEPVDYRHWEIYAASHWEHDPAGTTATLPHAEVNYGAAPNLQIHLILPLAYVKQAGAAGLYGPGDTELGVKYRFVQETSHRPMIGVFPLVEIPTGSSGRGLGNGRMQLFVPVWFQKSWGDWTSYGGGGYFFNSGDGNKDYQLAGWELQRDLNRRVTIGAELFVTTPTVVGGETMVNVNVGGQFNLSNACHILYSVGRSIHNTADVMGYLAFQWTAGPSQNAR
jgi:hypothetical protein